MLNIFKLKTKEENKKSINFKPQSNNYLWNNKYFPMANREWTNSIYSYFKQNNILLPHFDKIAIKIIRSYFNMHNYYLERIIKLRNLRKKQKKIFKSKFYWFWISKCEIKHTNDKIIIIIYIYNKQYNIQLKKLKLKLLLLKNKINSNIINQKREINSVSTFYKEYFIISKKIGEILYNKFKYNNFDINLFTKTNNNFINNKIIKDLSIKKWILYLKFKQVILFKKLKFTKNLLLPLRNLFFKVYNKNLEFNIITLKNSYLNSDIMSQILITRIKKKKRKPVGLLSSYIRTINTPILNDRGIIRERNNIVGIYNETIRKFLINNHSYSEYKDEVNIFIDKKYKLHNINKQNIIFNNIKYKILSGVLLQASGRLTKRITASRSVYKFRQTGSLKNIDSSYKGLSSVMLRGKNKSNIQFTLLKSKISIGAFGLKGWIAGY